MERLNPYQGSFYLLKNTHLLSIDLLLLHVTAVNIELKVLIISKLQTNHTEHH